LVTDAEIEHLATTWRPILYHHARRLLGREWQDYADDVVSETFLAVWKHRETILCANAYAIETVCTLARTWPTRRAYHSELQLVTDGLAVETSAPNAEDRMIEADRKTERAQRRARILNKLTPRQQQNYRAWRANGYHCHTHTESLSSTRVRQAIAAASGVATVPYMRVSQPLYKGKPTKQSLRRVS